MARARIIKPGFYANEQLAECSLMARFIFPGLWMLADRRGRMEDRPKRIKAALLPYDDGDIDALLDELAKHGLVLRYEVEGKRFILIVEFEKHQRCHAREPESTYPAPNEAVPRHNLGDASTVPEHNLGDGEAPPICPEAVIGNPLPEAEAEKPARKEPRATRLPPDWVLPDEQARWALQERPDWKPDDVIRVSLLFRDHWRGKGEARADWAATWRNWVRRERANSTAPPRALTAHEKRTATARAMYGDTFARQPTDITADSERLA